MPVKPSSKEEEYFARLEFERLKKIKDEFQQKMEDTERETLKEVHFMRCPKCGLELVELDFRNIRIDKCTGCEGVWLDAGELEQVAGLEKPALSKFFDVFRKSK